MKRPRPVGAAEVFTAVGILVMAASFMGIRSSPAQREPVVQDVSLTAAGALSVLPEPSESRAGEPTEPDTNSDFDVQHVALTERPE